MFSNYVSAFLSKNFKFLKIANKFNIDLNKTKFVKQHKKFYALYDLSNKPFLLKTSEHYILEDSDICEQIMRDKGFVSIRDKFIEEFVAFFNMMSILNGNVDIVQKKSKLYYVEEKKRNFIFEQIQFCFSKEDSPLCLSETSFDVVYLDNGLYSFGRVDFGWIAEQACGPYFNESRLYDNMIFDKMNEAKFFSIQSNPDVAEFFPDHIFDSYDHILDQLKKFYLGRYFPLWEQVGIPKTQEDADLIKMLSY